MSNQVEIGPARPEERAAVLRVVEAAGLPLEGLEAHLATTLVARQNERLIGCAALELYPGGALLRSVAVDASARGQGLGQQLTNAAMDMAARAGARSMYLLTTTAEGFFPKFGFVQIARVDVPEDVRASVEFASACPESAVVMRKVM